MVIAGDGEPGEVSSSSRSLFSRGSPGNRCLCVLTTKLPRALTKPITIDTTDDGQVPWSTSSIAARLGSLRTSRPLDNLPAAILLNC